jgi:hypothetical protein
LDLMYTHKQDLADADSDEWPSDSDESESDSDSDADAEVDLSALPKGRAFWVKVAVTDDSKAKRDERRAAKQEESMKKVRIEVTKLILRVAQVLCSFIRC